MDGGWERNHSFLGRDNGDRSIRHGGPLHFQNQRARHSGGRSDYELPDLRGGLQLVPAVPWKYTNNRLGRGQFGVAMKIKHTVRMWIGPLALLANVAARGQVAAKPRTITPAAAAA